MPFTQPNFQQNKQAFVITKTKQTVHAHTDSLEQILIKLLIKNS